MRKLIKNLYYKLTGKQTKKGTVKFFNSSKGFGFIKQEGGQEVFVHATGLIDRIHENDIVQFELKNSEKGLSAVNVKKLVS